MATGLIIGFCLLMSVITCDGFHVLGSSAPLTVQLGDSVMLPCSVENPVPMEELEVEWKRNDSGSLVHLWQDGESRPESQDQRYRERAHFFTEEFEHGNFSMLLTNVTRDDAGVYKCVIYTNLESDETLIEINEIERLIVSGAHVISAYVGEDITLNCSVDSHITPENIEEISWKKMDEDILVLLYEKGEVLTDSSHNRYRDRAEFFSVEERNKGNFSMRLKDVQTEDKGLYTCEAFSGKLSHNTSVEVQQLGLSSMHIGILVSCIFGFVFGSLVLGHLAYTSVRKNGNSRRALAILCAHVLCPNITMSIVFILWGVTDGFFSEAAACSALNFFRIIFLLWIAVHFKIFSEFFNTLISHLAIPLQYAVINIVAYSPIIVDAWYKADTGQKVMLVFLPLEPFLNLMYVIDLGNFHRLINRLPILLLYSMINVGAYSSVILYVWIKADITAWKVVILVLLLLGPCLNFLYVMANVCCKRILQKQTEMTYITTENSNCLRICAIILTYGLSLQKLSLTMLSLLALIWFVCYFIRNRQFLLWISVMMILEVISASGLIYLHYDLQNNAKVRDTLTCATAFLYILTVMILFASLKKLSESDDNNTMTQSRSDSINSGTQPRLSHVVVFFFGSVVVVFVNAVTLFVELILKARNGHHTVDLPLILIPPECIFAVCCMALQISDFWRKNRNRFREDMNRLRRVCMCKETPPDPHPQCEENEGENLALSTRGLSS